MLHYLHIPVQNKPQQFIRLAILYNSGQNMNHLCFLLVSFIYFSAAFAQVETNAPVQHPTVQPSRLPNMAKQPPKDMYKGVYDDCFEGNDCGGECDNDCGGGGDSDCDGESNDDCGRNEISVWVCVDENTIQDGDSVYQITNKF